MITSLTKNFTLERLFALAPDMLLPVCSIVLAMTIGLIFVRLQKAEKVFWLQISLLLILCLLVYLLI